MKTMKTKLAGALAAALCIAAPLAMSTPAAAAPQIYGHDNDRGHDNGRHDNFRGNDHGKFRYGYDSVKYRDRYHKPPQTFEKMPPRPHYGWHFHQGHWNWSGNHWMWMIGFWSLH